MHTPVQLPRAPSLPVLPTISTELSSPETIQSIMQRVKSTADLTSLTSKKVVRRVMSREENFLLDTDRFLEHCTHGSASIVYKKFTLPLEKQEKYVLVVTNNSKKSSLV
jgi:hypothetical protein